jgi:uncharacterized protein (DUF1697 family)
MPRCAACRASTLAARDKVAMADLRQAAASPGRTEVATRVPSGNVIFTSPDTNGVRITEALEQAITRQRDVRPAVVVPSRAACARDCGFRRT